MAAFFHGGPADPVQRIDTEKYAVETEDGFVSYGGVASLSATDDAVDLSFADQAAADLRLPDAHLHIALERRTPAAAMAHGSPAPSTHASETEFRLLYATAPQEQDDGGE